MFWGHGQTPSFYDELPESEWRRRFETSPLCFLGLFLVSWWGREVRPWSGRSTCGRAGGWASGSRWTWGSAGCWTRPVLVLSSGPLCHCSCWALSPAWKSRSSEKVTSHWQKLGLIRIIFSVGILSEISHIHQPFLQSETSLMAALAFDWVHSWASNPVICHVSVPVFTSKVGLT